MTDLDWAVYQAVDWLKRHPHRDYIDAAYAVVVAPMPNRSLAAASFSTGRWPELVQAVKEAVQSQAVQS